MAYIWHGNEPCTVSHFELFELILPKIKQNNKLSSEIQSWINYLMNLWKFLGMRLHQAKLDTVIWQAFSSGWSAPKASHQKGERERPSPYGTLMLLLAYSCDLNSRVISLKLWGDIPSFSLCFLEFFGTLNQYPRDVQCLARTGIYRVSQQQLFFLWMWSIKVLKFVSFFRF